MKAGDGERMSDFLSNLAARSLGSSEVVRPRLASLFEPPRPAVASSAGVLDGPSVLEEVLPAALELTRLVESRPATYAEDGGRDTQMQRAVVPAASDSPARPTEGVRSAPMSQAASAPTETGAESGPREVPTAPAARPALARDGPDAGEISPGAAERGSRRSVSEQLGSSREFRPSDVSRSEQVSIPSLRTSAPATIVVQPRVAPYSEPARSARAQPPPTAEPTIHVTIGRIEVRATQPAAPIAPRERQAPTVMSLEEYLRRRAKGSGR